MAIKNKVQVVVYVSPEVLEKVDSMLAAQGAAGGKTSRSQWVEQAMVEKAQREGGAQ